METTIKQKAILDSILGIVKTWKESDDIDSHDNSLIMDKYMFYDLADLIDEDEILRLQTKLGHLLDLIKVLR